MENNLKAKVLEVSAEVIQAADVLRHLVDGKLADLLRVVEELRERDYEDDTFDPEIKTAQILLSSVLSISYTVGQSTTSSYESEVYDVMKRAEFNGFVVPRAEA